MTDTRILIVVGDTEAGNAYLNAVAEIGAHCDIARNFDEMAAMATENRYNGFLIDILTLVRSSKEEKTIAYECINLFPVLRVKWEARHKRIKLSPLEETFSPDTASVLRFFIENRCKAFPARSLRRHARKVVNLNLLFCTGPDFSEKDAHRSFTINVGIHGIFMHTMHPFQEGDTIWLRFLEFPATSPIKAVVRWSRRWGVMRCIPGVGLEFEALTEEQEREVKRILNPL